MQIGTKCLDPVTLIVKQKQIIIIQQLGNVDLIMLGEPLQLVQWIGVNGIFFTIRISTSVHLHDGGAVFLHQVMMQPMPSEFLADCLELVRIRVRSEKIIIVFVANSLVDKERVGVEQLIINRI